LKDGAASSLPFNFSVLIASSDPERVERAKQEIVRFRRRMEKILHGTDQREVYMLAIDLLPLTPRYS
jgi:hypothetical protein